jgi:dGTPase
MGSKTQIITKQTKAILNDDFVRTRLTHSLEVAQIGGEIALNFGLNTDLAQTVCLAHDIGHPPFGHNGEKILNEIANDIGGFEGNAQTFRVLTRLANKKFIKNKRAIGLNLTRGVLNGVLKYPWTLEKSKTKKFSVYLPDVHYFNWVRKYSEENQPSIYAQIMDFSDDVAYSVADIEDTVITTNHNLGELSIKQNEIIQIAKEFFAKKSTYNQLNASIKRLSKLPFWVKKTSKDGKGISLIKNLTSELIERFVKSAKIINNKFYIPQKTSDEIAVLKSFSHIYFINTTKQIKIKKRQKQIIENVYKKYLKKPSTMRNDFYAEYKMAKNNKVLQKRIIIDAIASLTDESIQIIGKY